MPQLDSVTFFTQFFWTILSVFVFHFCLSKWIVPAFSRAQKSRSKVATLNSKSSLSDTTSTQSKGLRTSSSDSSLPKQSFSDDHSPKESTLTLLRQVLSLSFHTLLLGKGVETKFYKNRVQDMYANTTAFGSNSLPKKRKQITQLAGIATLVEKQSKYVESFLPDLSKTRSSSKKNKYVQSKSAIQMDDNLLSRRTQLFTTLRNIRQKVAQKSKTEWIPHGILNMATGYLQSPTPEKREQVDHPLILSSNGKGCQWLRLKKVKISPSRSSSHDINKNKNQVEESKPLVNKESKSKSKSKKIQTPKNKK